MWRLFVERISKRFLAFAERTQSAFLLSAFRIDHRQFPPQIHNRLVQLVDKMLLVRKEFFELHDAEPQRICV